MKLEHIVTATDFSEASVPALSIAGAWAKARNARLSLLHAYDPWPLGPSMSEAAGDDLAKAETAKEVAKAVDEELSRVVAERFGDVEVTKKAIAQPAAWLAVCDYASEEDADLIVVGSHGRTGIERLLIGSTAERVTRHASCPVLTVRGSVSSQDFPRHILVATDFSEASESAFEPARELATKHGSKLTVGHVYDASPIMFGEHPSFTDAATLDAELKDRLKALMEARFAGVAGVRMALLAAPSPVMGLSDYAREEQVDLLVVATHGRSGVKRVLMGSVAERIVRHAPCSVLAVRSR
jgi:nucleotide-binding universal stress UspA family protein